MSGSWIALLTEDPEASARRFPAWIWHGERRWDLRAVPDATGHAITGAAAMVVDGSWTGTAPDHDMILWGPRALADDDGAARDDQAVWLPLAFAPELAEAARLVADGAVGAVRHIDVTVTIDAGTASDGWEADAPQARDEFEAVLLGLHALDVLGLPAVASHPLPGGLRGIRHDIGGLGDTASAAHRILPSDLWPLPCLTAEVFGDEGRLRVRGDLDPGALVWWRRGPRRFTVPALPKPKPNIQAPDSARGGVETAALLRAVLAGDRPEGAGVPRARALLADTRAALSCLPRLEGAA